MAATPVGYDAFQSKRRKGLTLLAFILASTLFTSLTTYVDSYSIHYWDEVIDIGPIGMKIQGANILSYEEDIRNIPGVTKVVSTTSIYLDARLMKNDRYVFFESWKYNPELFSVFPTLIDRINGSLPTSPNEISIHNKLAADSQIDIGDTLNYSFDTMEYQIITVVGIIEFNDSYSQNHYGFYPTGAIISNNIQSTSEFDGLLIVDIDRSTLTPFNAAGSLQYVERINNDIYRLDPFYDERWGSSQFWIENYVSQSLMYFVGWQYQQRMNQIFRCAGVGLLVGLVTFLAIRNNINERRYESSMLIARGASEDEINRIINREIYGLSFLGIPFGIILGVLFSRIALASNGFLSYDPIKLFTEPFMISIESLIISSILGFFLPVGVLIAYRSVYSTKKRVDESEGKLAKVSRLLAFIRWDALVLITTVIALMLISSVGNIIYQVPIIYPVIVILPPLLFLALSSLATKGLRRGSLAIASVTSRVTGFLPSAIGVRRIGKEASSAGPALMVLVLTISLVWTSATVDSSLPTTKIAHTRFGLGGDVAFAISDDYTSSLDELLENISLHTTTESVSVIRNLELSLSAMYSEEGRFSAINPAQYEDVGFDERGVPLNESELGRSLDLLKDTPNGAVITNDIAELYSVSIGDTLRSFQFSDDDTEIITFSILDIVEALPDTTLFSDYRRYDRPSSDFTSSGRFVGTQAIWVNWNFVESILNITNTDTRICVRVKSGANGTELVQSMLEQGAGPMFEYSNWQSVSKVIDSYLSSSSYIVDRSVDSMLLAIEVMVLLGAFTLYSAEGIRNRRREIALLRSLGAERKLVIKAQVAEMLVIAVMGLMLLAIFTPVLLTNTMATHISSYESVIFIFPVNMIISVPWILLFVILGFFLGSIGIFALGIALASSKVNIAEALNASWGEAGPYGGDV